MQAVTTIGLDIAKSVFQIHGVDAAGNVIVRRQLKRRYVLPFFQRLPPCLVGIEACASSHHWSRELKALGHTVKLMPRSRLGDPKRLDYGPTPVEALDLYPTEMPNAPIFVFIHGGAWRGGEAKDFGFPAELFVNASVNYIVLDFIAVGAANGDISVMADQVRRGIAWTYKHAASFGGDANRLYIGG